MLPFLLQFFLIVLARTVLLIRVPLARKNTQNSLIKRFENMILENPYQTL